LLQKLEKDIGVELFYRIGKKVILTNVGLTLLKFIDKQNEKVLDTFHRIKQSAPNYSHNSACFNSW
jgi:DNA-binding transcriptional LysR family regulator